MNGKPRMRWYSRLGRWIRTPRTNAELMNAVILGATAADLAPACRLSERDMRSWLIQASTRLAIQMSDQSAGEPAGAPSAR